MVLIRMKNECTASRKKSLAFLRVYPFVKKTRTLTRVAEAFVLSSAGLVGGGLRVLYSLYKSVVSTRPNSVRKQAFLISDRRKAPASENRQVRRW